MPATSPKQARFFRFIEHNPGEAKKHGVKMTHAQMHDFAKTTDAEAKDAHKHLLKRKHDG